jgi:hypothetical protein
MGGVGSGGWNKKYVGTIEGTVRIDAFRLKRQRILQSPYPHRVIWSSNGMKLLELSALTIGNTLELRDATAEGSRYPDALAQAIELFCQSRKVGGEVTVFLCPRCGTPRQHLYLKRNRFICRKCAGLTYRVQREREVDRAFRRWNKVSLQLGGVSWESCCGQNRPKGMHKRRYAALCERLWAEESIVDASLFGFGQTKRDI